MMITFMRREFHFSILLRSVHCLRILNPPHGKRGGGGPVKKLRILPYAKFAR